MLTNFQPSRTTPLRFNQPSSQALYVDTNFQKSKGFANWVWYGNLWTTWVEFLTNFSLVNFWELQPPRTRSSDLLWHFNVPHDQNLKSLWPPVTSFVTVRWSCGNSRHLLIACKLGGALRSTDICNTDTNHINPSQPGFELEDPRFQNRHATQTEDAAWARTYNRSSRITNNPSNGF